MQANNSSFWKYKVYADIRGSSWGKGRQTTVGVVDDGNFQCFRWLYFRNFRDKASIIIWR